MPFRRPEGSPAQMTARTIESVIGAIRANALLLNLGILVIVGWYVATKQDPPMLLLGALIANSGQALGALTSVLNSTRSEKVPEGTEEDPAVVKLTDEPIATREVAPGVAAPPAGERPADGPIMGGLAPA